MSNIPGGVVVPLATPLTEMETLDVPALRQLVHCQLQAGVDALFVLGSCGEGLLLTEEIRMQMIRITIEAADGAVPVYAGASDNSVVRALEHINRLAETGTAAAVWTTKNALVVHHGHGQHYRRDCGKARLPTSPQDGIHAEPSSIPPFPL